MLRKNVFARLFSNFSFSENVAMNARTALLSIAILFVAGWNSTAQAVLQAYWKFDEVAGSTAANSSGSVTNYNGTLTNFVTDDSQWQSGRFGNALRYLDANDVVLLNSNVVDINSNWTISAWFLAPIANDSQYHTLARGTNDHQILLEPSASHLLGTYDNVGGTGFHGTAPAYAMNTLSVGFHQIVAVGAGTNTTFYIDGNQVGVSTFKSVTDVYALGNYQGTGQKFADKLDDMGVFDQALTDAEAKSIFSLAMVPELNYNLGEANQLIQAFESSAPSIQIGDQIWTLITDGSLTGAEGEVVEGGNLMAYSINFGDGNGFAVLLAPEPSSLLLGAMGCVILMSRRRRARGN